MSRISQGIQACLSWVRESNGNVPDNAIEAGPDMYIGRCYASGGLVPGKVVPRFGKAYIPYGGKEIEHYTYEVLCDTKVNFGRHCYKWEHAFGGNVPRYAVIAGLSENREPLYVARGEVQGECVVGKVHEGHTCAYFPYGGEEHSVYDYEVLVMVKWGP